MVYDFFLTRHLVTSFRSKIKAVERAHILRQQIHPLMCL
nr:MAG TPA: hypothetical protein [Bacteriophage sp.]DAZ02648.1 MAG TPA: hypothetical protein [Caudoviricetes sp.]